MFTKDEREKRRSNFSASKQALLEKRLQGVSSHDGAAVIIPKRPVLEMAPTSFSQQRLWFLDQLEPGTATYHIPIAMRIGGQLNVPVLERCLNTLIQRHEAWRTTFQSSEDSAPLQHINAPWTIHLPVTDLSYYPAEQREKEAIKLATENARQPFDLSQGPLIRVLLLSLSTTEHIFVLTQHHIISDGWSIGVILPEIVTLYEAFLADKLSPLPDLPIQYADYAYWQQQRLQGPELERQIAYWKQQLADCPPYIELPTDRTRLDVQTSHGKTLHFQLSNTLSSELRKFCQKEEATLFMTLMATFQALLYRYTGQQDLMISTSIANRTLPEVENVVGFFVNTLILRTNLEGDPEFRTLLKHVHDVSLAAYAHQEVPFERAVTHIPSLQVLFILQNTPMHTQGIEGLALERIELDNDTAKFDLYLNVEDASEICGFFEYNVDLFDTTTIEQLSQHFQRLLEAVIQNPEKRLSEFPLLSEQERHLLLSAWSTGDTVARPERCLHELFEEQVAHTPQLPALEFAGSTLTYQELNQRANQVAHYLHSLGVDSEIPVGICMERSIEQMVGILGILKARGYYVPLDPSSPEERLAWMLADAQIKICLTQTSLQAHLPVDVHSICLDTPGERLAEMPTTSPMHQIDINNLAYAIYTSGSTGKPKGVLISHRSIVNHSLAIAQHFAFQSSDRVLQFSSLSFDAAGEELYPTWLSGATLVLRPEYLPASAQSLYHFIEQERLTILDLPTAFWHQWVASIVATPLPLPASLRLVIVGGERVQAAHYRQWIEHIGSQIEWSNTYGPTETTITALLYHPTDVLADPHSDTAPIGRPIANMQVYLLDPQLQPVPRGAVGEIYLGGVGLARAYLHRPDLTAERFIDHPYGQPDERLYRTGDLARYLSDGFLHYIGRSDQQVKIRGYRIEPGEIENVLLQHPEIEECIVQTQEDTLAEISLVAYIVGIQSSSLSSREVRQFLQGHLPEYMVPTSYVFLESFPVTTSGKIDRRALPAPLRNRDGSAETYTQPRTPLEEIIAGIWSSVLAVEQVGIHDNFFDIGGHSLLATQVIVRLQNLFSIDLPLRRIFEYPTTASLAEAMLKNEHERELVEATALLLLSVVDLSDEEAEALLHETE